MAYDTSKNTRDGAIAGLADQIALLPTALTANKLAIARNPNTPKEFLIELGKDKDNWVLCQVAGNPNTISETLAALAMERFSPIRILVALHSNTPSEVLAALAADENEYVRFAATARLAEMEKL